MLSYSILKCPTENQIGVTIVAVLIILGVIGLYYALEESEVERVDYRLFVSEMGCDALEFQATNHAYESYRSIALKEHGGRC